MGPVTDHTHGEGWCSVIGGRVYRGTEFPRLYGRYIYTDFCPTPYFSLRPDGVGGWIREQVRPNNGGSGTACIAENSALELFVANVNNGTIKRIVDQCPMPAPDITLDGFDITSTPADTYTWFLDGEEIPGAETQTITAEAAGAYYVVGTFGTCSLTSDTVQVVGTSITNLATEGFKVIPVPARDRITLEGVPAGTAQVELIDLTGRVVFSRSWNSAARGVFDVSELENAGYILRLSDATGAVITQRNVQVQR